MRRLTLLFALCLPLLSAAHPLVPGAVAQRSVLIRNGTLHTVSHGVLPHTDLLIADGHIAAIGTQLQAPDGTKIVDAAGRHVYPGLIALDTEIGLTEIGAVRATRDLREVGELHPEVRAAVAFNADSEVIPTVRSNGIALAQVVPEGGIISGQSSLMRLDGWNWEDMLAADALGVHVRWPRMGARGFFFQPEDPAKQREAADKRYQAMLRAFDDAKAYAERRKSDPHFPIDLRWEAMRGLFDASKKTFVHADSYREITQALEFCTQRKLRCVLVGARDAWRLAERLAAAQVPVIYAVPFGMPIREDDAVDQSFRVPGLLKVAGVHFALGYPSSWDVRNLPFAAGYLAGNGLSKAEALRAVTLSAAEILGVGADMGSLDVGKQANIVVSRGDLLDALGLHVEQMWIGGREVDLDNRHKALYRKYGKRLGSARADP